MDVLEIFGIDKNSPKTRDALEDHAMLKACIDKLVAARKEAGISQEEVAEYLETQQPSVSQLERLTAIPSTTRLMAYARAINYHLNFVVTPSSNIRKWKLTTPVSKPPFDNVNHGEWVDTTPSKIGGAVAA